MTHTGQSLSQMARFHTRLDRLVLQGGVVVADAVYALVASFAEPETERIVKQRCEGDAG